MSLKAFHIFFIATANALMAFTTYWSIQEDVHYMTVFSLLGVAVGLPYFAWFLKKSRTLR